MRFTLFIMLFSSFPLIPFSSQIQFSFPPATPDFDTPKLSNFPLLSISCSIKKKRETLFENHFALIQNGLIFSPLP